MRRQVEFQEAVVQTQLFVGFMDASRTESHEKDSSRRFIRDWAMFRTRIKNKNKAKKSAEEECDNAE